MVVLHFTSNAICIMSARNERRTSRTTCETKGKKRQASRNNYWKDPAGHLPGRPPMPVIGGTLRRKGRPPMPVIGRTLRRKGVLPYPLLGGP